MAPVNLGAAILPAAAAPTPAAQRAAARDAAKAALPLVFARSPSH